MIFNSTSNTLEFWSSDFREAFDDSPLNSYYQPESLSQIFNSDISGLFKNCRQLNSANIKNSEFNFNFCEPRGDFITNMYQTFWNCSNFNQNVQIPNTVDRLSYCFFNCVNLNQNILIPNSVTSIYATFRYCSHFNRSDLYIYSQNIDSMAYAFENCHINNIHIPTSVPKSTSNFMYNSLVNGVTRITFPAANIFNDLPVDIKQWPPV